MDGFAWKNFDLNAEKIFLDTFQVRAVFGKNRRWWKPHAYPWVAAGSYPASLSCYDCRASSYVRTAEQGCLHADPSCLRSLQPGTSVRS